MTEKQAGKNRQKYFPYSPREQNRWDEFICLKKQCFRVQGISYILFRSFEIRGIQTMFFEEVIEIGPVFSGQFRRIAYIAPG